MKASEWLRHAPRGAVRELSAAVGTSEAYMYHITAGIKRPGLKLAVKIAEESHRITPKGMTIAALVGIDHLPEHLIMGARAEKKG